MFEAKNSLQCVLAFHAWAIFSSQIQIYKPISIVCFVGKMVEVHNRLDYVIMQLVVVLQVAREWNSSVSIFELKVNFEMAVVYNLGAFHVLRTLPVP